MIMRNNISLKYELELLEKGYKVVAGVDEVGRGCLAGPVYAALVSFGNIKKIPKELREVNDSKKLNAKNREKLSALIKERADFFTIKSASVTEINKLGIVGALDLAMERCLNESEKNVDFVLIDGYENKKLSIKNRGIIGGDALCFSIAAASIIVKVERDRVMEELSEKYKNYGFEKHKGYGTKQHFKAIEKYGICEMHRTGYKPIKNLIFNQ